MLYFLLTVLLVEESKVDMPSVGEVFMTKMASRLVAWQCSSSRHNNFLIEI
jgi:hypothetical protein